MSKIRDILENGPYGNNNSTLCVELVINSEITGDVETFFSNKSLEIPYEALYDRYAADYIYGDDEAIFREFAENFPELEFTAYISLNVNLECVEEDQWTDEDKKFSEEEDEDSDGISKSCCMKYINDKKGFRCEFRDWRYDINY